jgi:hypothetical protein
LNFYASLDKKFSVMKRKTLITLVLSGCFMVCLAAIADMSGKWAAVFNAPDGNAYPLSYDFKVNGDKLTGTLDAAGMSVPIDSGKVSGEKLSFSVTVQGNTYSHKGQYYAAGDSIAVDVEFEGGKGHMTFKRP